MGIVEAQQKCPDLVLVSGEDLTPYRHAVSVHLCKGASMKLMLKDLDCDSASPLVPEQQQHCSPMQASKQAHPVGPAAVWRL